MKPVFTNICRRNRSHTRSADDKDAACGIQMPSMLKAPIFEPIELHQVDSRLKDRRRNANWRELTDCLPALARSQLQIYPPWNSDVGDLACIICRLLYPSYQYMHLNYRMEEWPIAMDNQNLYLVQMGRSRCSDPLPREGNRSLSNVKTRKVDRCHFPFRSFGEAVWP